MFSCFALPRLLPDAVSFHDVLACAVLYRLSLFVVICVLDQLSQLIVLVVDLLALARVPIAFFVLCCVVHLFVVLVASPWTSLVWRALASVHNDRRF